MPPITPVLCFVEGDSTRSLRKRLDGTVLDEAAIARLGRILAAALPPK